MWKKHDLIVLPAESKSALHLDRIQDKFITTNSEIYYSSSTFSQHLYILSDEDIKGGDWIFSNDSMYISSHIGKLTIQDVKLHQQLKRKIFHKIIATNNPELIKDGIASIDGNFIEQWIVNPVDKVELEYNTYIKNRRNGTINTKTVELGEGISKYFEEVTIMETYLNGDVKCRFVHTISDNWEDIIDDFIDTFPCQIPQELVEFLEKNYEVPKGLKQ